MAFNKKLDRQEVIQNNVCHVIWTIVCKKSTHLASISYRNFAYNECLVLDILMYTRLMQGVTRNVMHIYSTSTLNRVKKLEIFRMFTWGIDNRTETIGLYGESFKNLFILRWYTGCLIKVTTRGLWTASISKKKQSYSQVQIE